jgi:hypothetical protein
MRPSKLHNTSINFAKDPIGLHSRDAFQQWRRGGLQWRCDDEGIENLNNAPQKNPYLQLSFPRLRV